MNKPPITHLVIDTSSTNEDYNGDCDYCLVPMTAEYILYLLGYMDEVRRMHRADDAVYSLECWDGSFSYFQFNDKLEELRDVDGNLAVDVPRGEPILLTADPQFREDDFQRVECQTVQIISEDVWWTAYVKHTNTRIESAHVEKRTLLRILRSLGGDWKHRGNPGAKPIPPAVRRIHDLLYLDMKNGREFCNPDKVWDADTLTQIAEVVAKYIPRPSKPTPNPEP
jgi:hypothetical protein